MSAVTLQIVVTAIVMAVAYGVGIIGWYRWRGSSGPQPSAWLTMEPRPSVPWGFIDIPIVGLFWVMCTLTVSGVMSAWWGTSVPRATAALALNPTSLLAMAVGSLLACWFSLAWLRARDARWYDLGMSRQGWLRDIALGLVTFLILAPGVFQLQSCLTQIWPWPQQHPLVEALLQGGSRQLYWSAFSAAVIAAPIWEEFLFRVVIQGWLERLAALWRQSGSLSQALIRTLLLGTYGTAAPELPGTDRPFHWPIAVSSLLFAAAHLGHGPAPIPLFVLALGLGYLYERTHRWLPCIVTHMLVNGTTMALLGLTIEWK